MELVQSNPTWPFRAAPTERKPLLSSPPVTGLPPWLRHGLRTLGHILFDVLAITAAYRSAFWARFEWAWLFSRIPLSGEAVAWEKYQGLLYAAVPIWLLLLRSNQVYTASFMGSSDRFIQIVKAAALGTLTTLAPRSFTSAWPTRE